MANLSRRSILGGALTAPLFGQDSGGRAAPRIVFVGAHPDDPQSGCGGLMALYARQGAEVTALFLTRGELGIRGKSPQETSAIRSAEAEKSCSILGARPVFARQTDAATHVDPKSYDEFAGLLLSLGPSLVFTHWPIDTHPDHRAASLLTYEAWKRSKSGLRLFYYEVELGSQTQTFSPTAHVDITAVEKQKREACFAHVSTVHEWWPLHQDMHRFRGLECGVTAAEAYAEHVPGERKLAL